MDGSKQTFEGGRSGIFSNPDLTVDAEKLAAHKPSPSAVKHDAPAQSPQSRKRKMPVIVVIAAVIVLVGVVVFSLIMRNHSSSDKSISNVDSVSLKEALNRYVSFLVSGKTDIAAFTDSDFDPYNSRLYSVVYSSEANIAKPYFSEAQTLLDAFLKHAQAAYNSNSNQEEEIILSLAESNELQLKAVEEYITSKINPRNSRRNVI